MQTEIKQLKFMVTFPDDAKRHEVERCFCTDGCSDQCINVSCNMECTADCTNCINQNFRMQKNLPKVTAKDSNFAGKGLFAAERIVSGRFIIPYIGEVISKDERISRSKKYEKGNAPSYFLESGKYTIDPTVYGNDAKFANHSCDPNMVAEKWICDQHPAGFEAIGFTYIRNIEAGEELTFHYGNRYADSMKCYCGSVKCTGFVGKSKADVAKMKKIKERGTSSDAVVAKKARRTVP